MSNRTASRYLALSAALAIATLTACDDDGPVEEPEPEIASMELIIGTDTVRVSDNGTVTNGPLTIAVGANTITGRFLRANGQPDPLVDAATFRLEGDSDTPGTVTFTSNQLGGTLTGVASGTGNVGFSLFHIAEGHEDFGPFPVPVVVP